VVPEAYKTPVEQTLHQSPVVPTAYVPDVHDPRDVLVEPALANPPVVVAEPIVTQFDVAPASGVDLSLQKKVATADPYPTVTAALVL